MRCPACSAEVPAGFRFCGHCGTPLAEAERVEPERRQLTVMFCDLVGSTALSERLDPEDLHQLLRLYQHEAVEVAERYDGHVAQYLGDGLLIYFGYPTAHEDDARRAVLAGLGIAQAVERLGGELAAAAPGLAVRVGIHTGPVVAGEVGAGERIERLAMGETPNVAARLQGLAEPGTVVVSQDTRRLAGELCHFEPLGERRLRGLSRPIAAYRVVAARLQTGVVDVARLAAQAPPVGRERELARLEAVLDDTAAGRGQRVVITGEAGIGKSRLVQAATARAGEKGLAVLACATSPYHRNTPLFPLPDLLGQLFGLTAGQAPERQPERQLARVAARAGQLGLPDDAVPLLAALAGIPAAAEVQALRLTPQRIKERQVELAVELLLAAAGRRPCLLVVEDLHWVDPSTLELLHALAGRLAEAPLTLLLTRRPEPEVEPAPEWEPPALALSLGRLDEAAARQVVARVTGGKPLPAPVTAQVVAKTDGVPLFIEELTRMLLSSGHLEEGEDAWELTTPLPELSVPTTLQDSLMARLDRMGEAKGVAQLASVLGREVPFELIAAVAREGPEALAASLARLVEADLLTAGGDGRTYVFRHALLQDAAYESLLKKTRQRLHGRTADVLLERFPERAAAQPELVAHHLSAAGRPEPAVDWLTRAAQGSLGRAAAREAVRQAEKGLLLLAGLPDAPARRRRELALQATAGAARTAVEGFAATAVVQAYRRSLELCAEAPDAPELFWVTWGLWAYYFQRAELHQALALAERLRQLAGEDAALSLQAGHAEGATRFSLGDFTAARRALERALGHETPESGRAAMAATGQDTGVHARCYLAMTLWHLGEGDAARRRLDEALERARSNAQPLGLVLALLLATCLASFERDAAAVERYGREALGLAREQGLAFVLQAESFLGWLETAEGGAAAGRGVEKIERALAVLRGSGARLSETQIVALLAEGHLRRGEPEQAVRRLDEALAAAEERGERYWQPELLRLRGECRHAGGGDPLPDFQAAVRTARQLGSVALERRAREAAQAAAPG
jgi:class 3 adenylate cyclase/tetratricopeptide (TPR) repeat protein